MRKELLKRLSEEQIAKIRECKTSDEILALAKEEGVELTEEQMEAVADTNGSKHPDLLHIVSSHHRRDAHLRVAVYTQTAAWRHPAHLGKYHYRLADNTVYIAIPAGYGHEEKPLGRMESAVEREQPQPSAPVVHHSGTRLHSRDLHLLHLQQTVASD